MAQYVKRDGPPKIRSDELNMFVGYDHVELTDTQFEEMSNDPELMELVDRVHWHFLHILSAQNVEFN